MDNTLSPVLLDAISYSVLSNKMNSENTVMLILSDDTKYREQLKSFWSEKMLVFGEPVPRTSSELTSVITEVLEKYKTFQKAFIWTDLESEACNSSIQLSDIAASLANFSNLTINEASTAEEILLIDTKTSDRSSFDSIRRKYIYFDSKSSEPPKINIEYSMIQQFGEYCKLSDIKLNCDGSKDLLPIEVIIDEKNRKVESFVSFPGGKKTYFTSILLPKWSKSEVLKYLVNHMLYSGKISQRFYTNGFVCEVDSTIAHDCRYILHK